MGMKDVTTATGTTVVVVSALHHVTAGQHV